ncbi:ABC transporter permease [Aerococcaceae bacterium zg-BR22]|uniref:ABC transporter permease n=1 Tax=Aerococcaceae bacterium zg-1292 TaxID=2774330 RepID=UPI0040633F53|nr:ABC transporter permease [Aerococcaceae bacterium zg-BR22]
MNKMWIIIKEVYRKNVRSGGFLAMVFGPIVMFAIIGLIGYFVGTSTMKDSIGHIGLVQATPEVQQALEKADTGNEFERFESDKAATRALKDGKIDGYLVVDESMTPLSATFFRDKLGKDIDVRPLTKALESYAINQRLVKEGIAPATLDSINNTHVSMKTSQMSFDDAGNAQVADQESMAMFIRTGVAYGVCFIVYLFIMQYVSIISQEIATEKGSRIMEVILSSISATKHFFGKMIGIGLVILTQLAIYLLIGLIALMVIRTMDLSFVPKEVMQTVVPLIGTFKHDIMLGGVFAIMGILTYTSIAGFLGSLVSRMEDVNKMVTPLVLVGLVGFYIGMYALSSTNNALVRIGSQIPFFTPFVMPFRIAAETVSTNEIVLSVILSLIFMVLSLAVSTVFYKSNVLVTSDKGLIQTFKRSYQLWRSERE